VLLLDNYDSFTYNLYQYLGELGAEVDVFRNDQITVDEAMALKPAGIVLSPGPCTPNEAGICMDLVKERTACREWLGFDDLIHWNDPGFAALDVALFFHAKTARRNPD
jgi:anthranilate/para-aminobenzoate synthase component II